MCDGIEEIEKELGITEQEANLECAACGVKHCTLDPISCYAYYGLGSTENQGSGLHKCQEQNTR